MDGNVPINDLEPAMLSRAVRAVCRYRGEGIDPVLVVTLIIELIRCWNNRSRREIARRLKAVPTWTIRGWLYRRYLRKKLGEQFGPTAADELTAGAVEYLQGLNSAQWEMLAGSVWNAAQAA